MSKYRGISYPFSNFFLLKWVSNWWKRHMCRRHYHLFDEVYSPCTGEEKDLGYYEHYLVCDVCQLMVIIEKIEDKYVQ